MARFGAQVDVKGIIAPSPDADRAVRYGALREPRPRYLPVTPSTTVKASRPTRPPVLVQTGLHHVNANANTVGGR